MTLENQNDCPGVQLTGPGESASPKAPKAVVDLTLQLKRFEEAMERDGHGIAPNGARYRIIVFTNDKHTVEKTRPLSGSRETGF